MHRKASTLHTVVHRVFRIPYSLHVEEFMPREKFRQTVVFIHGIGNTLHAWDGIVKKLPEDVRAIGVDLLGFGESPRPHWVQYSAKTQARSVGLALLKANAGRKVTLVGHSLGALVAIEVARRYPLLVKRLVLVSPPFYEPEGVKRTPWNAEVRLRHLYRVVKKHPKTLSSLAPLAAKMGVANKSLRITPDSVDAYIATLEASIINQTALKDIMKLTLPIKIIYGALDPVVISKHITRISKEKKNISVKKLITGHEIRGPITGIIAKEIVATINDAA